ncbi:MAG: FAD-dependent oxidoreductase [Thermoplasmata archaeon]|nr:FAD-dependent oxidoreductase [Thermoplasmata archaeon]
MTEEETLLIIGGGVAGFRVAALANEKCPEINTIVVTPKSHGVVSSCGIPFGLEQRFELAKLILATPEYYAEKGIAVKFSTEVTSLELERNQVHLKQLNQPDSEVLDYDYLVLATGRAPFVPPIPGVELEGVFTLSNYEDAQALQTNLNTTTPTKAVVIGAGPIGMETGWALKQLGIETTLVELLPAVFPQTLDPDIAEIVQSHYEESGINILTGTSVNGIFSENSKVKYVTVGENNKKLAVDLVVIATGIRPNIELAKRAGLEIGALGGIVTDDLMRVKTAGGNEFIPNVYACGDCVQVINGITHQPTLSALASTVIPQARVIIENIKTPDSETNFTFKLCYSPNVTVVGGLEVGSVGVTTQSAAKAGLDNLVVGNSKGGTRSGYFPGAKKVYIKLIFKAENLIGAQVIGGEGVKGRIDALGTAIKAGLKLNDLMLLERSFTPPLALLVDPILAALEMARAQIAAINQNSKNQASKSK